MKKSHFSLLLILLVGGIGFSNPGIGQDMDSTRNALSAFLFPGRAQRSTGVDFDNLEALPKGMMKPFVLSKNYQRVFLGKDFFDESQKATTCDSLKKGVGTNAQKFVPVSDGGFFTSEKVTKLEQIEGYYRFKNNRFLPGIVPNSELWVRMEGFKTMREGEKNCLLIKLMIPEYRNGTIQNTVYLLRNDGKLDPLDPAKEKDLKEKKENSAYWIIPLNDMNNETHLAGKGFSILGSFVAPKGCHKLMGLVYPVSGKGSSGEVQGLFFVKAQPPGNVVF